MLIQSVKLSYFDKNFQQTVKKIPFRAANTDIFDCAHIENLKQNMYKNPELYYEDIIHEKCDLKDLFHTALLLRKEEKEKPYTTNKQKEIKKIITKLEKLRTTMLKEPNNYFQSSFDNNRSCMYNALKALANTIKNGKDETKIKKWGKICKMILKKTHFNPNVTIQDGQSLIDIALDNKDEEMALLLMKNKKFKKPEKFNNTESQKLFEDLEKKLRKNRLLSFFGF